MACLGHNFRHVSLDAPYSKAKAKGDLRVGQPLGDEGNENTKVLLKVVKRYFHLGI